jgi:hypothetical protein
MKTAVTKFASTAACVALMSLAAGCSGNHAPASGQAIAAAPEQQSDEVNNFRPCDKLSVADVQPFFNTPIKKIADAPSDAPIQNCTFATTDGIQAIQVMTAVGSTVSAFTNKSPTDDGKPGTPLTGIGDHAIREANDIWVYAFRNGSFCMIHGDHSGENAQGSVEEIRGLKISDSLAHTIPAATAQRVAQNLGTLCNKVWGSGNTTPTFTDPQ